MAKKEYTTEELRKIVSGAIYDFFGHLAHLEKDITVGGNSRPGPLLETLKTWAGDRGFPEDPKTGQPVITDYADNWEKKIGLT